MWQYFPCKVVPNCSESTVKSIGDITIVPPVKHIHSVKNIVSSIFLIIYLFCGMGIAGREGYWYNCFPRVFHVSFLFSVCIRSESIFRQLFLMMLSVVCFYIRYIPNLYCYHDHIGVSYEFFCCANISFEIFPCPGICSYFRCHRVLSLVFCGISEDI